MSEALPFRVRSTPARSLVEEWALVLSAERIPSRVVQDGGEWCLDVPGDAGTRAELLLQVWEQENEADPLTPDPAPWPEAERSVAGLGLAALLVSFHALVSFTSLPWKTAGSARAGEILAGELARGLTALTLHGDLGHLAGNALALTLFGNALGRALGPGLTAAVLLAAGGIGNTANAALRGAPHDSIGASTAVFAAVGVLAGRALVRRLHGGLRGARRIAPLAAGLAVLAMIGVAGERTDVAAHVMGLLAGTGIGSAVSALHPERPGPPAQLALGLGSLALLIGAWARVLH